MYRLLARYRTLSQFYSLLGDYYRQPHIGKVRFHQYLGYLVSRYPSTVLNYCFADDVLHLSVVGVQPGGFSLVRPHAWPCIFEQVLHHPILGPNGLTGHILHWTTEGIPDCTAQKTAIDFIKESIIHNTVPFTTVRLLFA